MQNDKTRQSKLGKRLSVWVMIVATILLIPLLAKAPWTAGDFVFGAIILFGFATTYELLTRDMSNTHHRALVGLGVVAALLFVWVAAATGFEGLLSN